MDMKKIQKICNKNKKTAKYISPFFTCGREIPYYYMNFLEVIFLESYAHDGFFSDCKLVCVFSCNRFFQHFFIRKAMKRYKKIFIHKQYKNLHAILPWT